MAQLTISDLRVGDTFESRYGDTLGVCRKIDNRWFADSYGREWTCYPDKQVTRVARVTQRGARLIRAD